MKKVIFAVKGMHCASCSSIISRALNKHDGVKSASVNLSTNKASIEYDEKVTNETNIISVIEQKGYRVANADQQVLKEEYRKNNMLFWIGAILTIPLVTFSMVVPLLSGYWQLLLATPVQFIIGAQFYSGAYSAIKRKTANMDTLVALGTSAAYIFSLYQLFSGLNHFYFEVAAVIITLILLGRTLEARAKMQTTTAIEQLMKLEAKEAIVLRNGKQVSISLSELQIGDTVFVKPGNTIAADGIIVNGTCFIDESMITGESIPIEKKKGDKVIGATINGLGSFSFKVTATGEKTTLAKIIQLVQDAQGRQAPIQKIADKVSAVFVPIILGIALLTFLIWFGITLSFESALISAVAVLVVACPCALGLATPTALMVGTGIGAKKGILIKGGDVLQKAQGIKYVAFDKTGTLTYGKPVVTDIVSLTKKPLLEIAASLESHSEHPLAIAITKKFTGKLEKVTEFKSITGSGIQGKIGNITYTFGKPKKATPEIKKLESEGKTVMVLSNGTVVHGYIAVADTIKDESSKVIMKLKKMNIVPILITGDNERVAQAIGKSVGISEIYSQVLPDEKSSIIESYKKKGIVAMVGDGINDAVALASADVGIAMGTGSDVAVESGSIVLMNGNLDLLPRAIKLSQKTMNTIKQNLFWAFFYNVMLIPLAAGVFVPFFGWQLSPMFAGAAMAFSSVSVVTNSLLLKVKV